jgi:serine/threonine-protein kinase
MTVVNKPRIVISVAALAGLTALGGVGAVMGSDTSAVTGTGPAHMNVTEVATTSSQAGSPTSSEESTDVSSPESSGTEPSGTEPSQPNNDAASTLMGMLPAGYDSSNCSPTNQGVSDALVTVDCKQNTLSNGLATARFALFGDKRTMDSKFNIFVSEDQLSPCPGGAQSPGTWSYNASSGDVAGQIACGTYQGTPDLTWTQNAELMLGNLQGSDLDSLYDYWSHPSGSNAAAPNRH